MPSRPLRRSLTLRTRATIAWGGIAFVLSAFLATFAYQVTRTQLIAEREDSATTSAYLNARLARSVLRGTDPDVTALLTSLEANADSVVLLRVAGEWFSGSVGPGPDAIPARLAEVVAEGSAGHVRFRQEDGPYIGVGIPIAAIGARYFELVPMADIERTLGDLAGKLLIGGALATMAAAAVGWYASGRVLRPLRRFTAAAEQIAGGDLGARLEPLADRDLQALERAFNKMAEAVQQRIDREARFTSDVSHELRGPVAAMHSVLSLARRRHRDPQAASDAIDDLEQRVEDLHELVENLLEISRVEAGVAQLQLEPVDPRRLAQALVETMGMPSLPVDVSGDVPEIVEIDKRRVGQMLQNLVENAERYGGGATRLAVSADASTIRFAVEDAGPGVPEHERGYIFERFARGEAAARNDTVTGTGLGLSLVSEHAALHGGSVHLEDRAGGGARFVVELPLRSPG